MEGAQPTVSATDRSRPNVVPVGFRRGALACAAVLTVLASCAESDPFVPGDAPDDPVVPGDTAVAPPPLRVTGPVDGLRTGDVIRFVAERGAGVTGDVTWRLDPADAGVLEEDGRFVGHRAGAVRVVATVGEVADTLDFVMASRGVFRSVTPIGQSAVPFEGTTDLWVRGGAAYTGTRSRYFEGVTYRGNALYTWDVSDPTSPALTSTLRVDAGTVNDVKVSGDGSVGALTHEGALDALNGITLLDLSDPLGPVVITRFTPPEFRGGVHNVWFDGGVLYVAGRERGGPLALHTVDLSNPANPILLATYWAESSFVHDIYVRDGLAFASHWDVGLVILDVGNGIAGGSPGAPVEVSRLPLGGNTHNAWYWPETGYVFVGEEDFSKPGVLHVVDASDLTAPVEVATYAFSGITPHNVWLDEERAVLWIGWYQGGLQALDVSGELWGELGRQNRVMVRSLYNNNRGCGTFRPDCTMAWAPQFEGGLVYVSDIGSGLWVIDPGF